MPSAEEFGSLIDPTQPIGSTALPSGHPFEGLLVNGERYWSSTTVWFDFPNVAVVFPLDTEETTIQSKDDLNWTWCVRGGNQMDTGLNMP